MLDEKNTELIEQMKKLSNNGISELIMACNQEIYNRWVYQLKNGPRHWEWCERCFETTQHHYDGNIFGRHTYTCLECGWHSGLHSEPTHEVNDEMLLRPTMAWLDHPEDVE